MKLEGILKYTIGFALAGLLFTSCDKIEGPYSKEIIVDTTSGEVQKHVLLEDYTGHMCPNCPDAAVLAENLKNNYGNKVIVIAVHAGWFARTGGDFTADYTCAAGNEWDAFFGISNAGNPNGMVNRKNYPGGHILAPADWGQNIQDALAEPLLVDVELSKTYNITTRQGNIQTKVTFLETLDKNLNLIVAITESGIVSIQSNNNPLTGTTPTIPDYEHKHMLRESLNGPWGTSIANAGVANPASLTRSFNFTLDEKYNAANCTVVAFICDSDSKEILQAAEIDL